MTHISLTSHSGTAGRVAGRSVFGCEKPEDASSKNISPGVASMLPYICDILPLMRSVSDLSYRFFTHLKPIANIESYNQVLRLTGVIMIPVGIYQMKTYLKMSKFANKAKDVFSSTLYKINALSNIIWVLFALDNGIVGTVLVSMKRIGHNIRAAKGMPIVGYIATGLYGLTSLCSLIGHIISASAGIKLCLRCRALTSIEDKIAHLRQQLEITDAELNAIKEKAKSKSAPECISEINSKKSDILLSLKKSSNTRVSNALNGDYNRPLVENIYIAYKIKQIEKQKQSKMATKLGLSKESLNDILNGTKTPDILWKNICKEMRSHFIWKTIKSIVNVMIVTSCSFVTLITPLAGDIMSFIINGWFIYSDFTKGSVAYKNYSPSKHDKKIMALCTLLSLAAVGSTLAISVMTGGTFPLVLATISAVAICSYNVYNWYHFIKGIKASKLLPAPEKPRLVEDHYLLKFKDYVQYLAKTHHSTIDTMQSIGIDENQNTNKKL